MTRIYLSPPHVGPAERELLIEAFDSNWIAPVGEHVDAFECELADYVGVSSAAALASGTAALHMALLVVGVAAGDEVIVPSLTFVATANAVTYVGARPVFVDSEPDTWNIDPDLVGELLADRARAGRLPAAAVLVDIYGQCADYDRLLPLFERYDIPVISDAAEALGASWAGRPAGSFGHCAVVSFNGNKVITTGGGGMLLSDDPLLTNRARFLSTQAREPTAHYEHREIGYNHRLCNLNAAVGRGQLRSLDEKVARRRAIKARYIDRLGDLPGVGFMPDDTRGTPSNWLTVVTLSPELGAPSPARLRDHLEWFDIESRPAWKPMHLQPLYKDAPAVGGTVAEEIFALGLCLPSGSNLSDADHDRVVDAIRTAEWTT